MELVKLLLLIVCAAILLFLVLPAIVVFFIFRVKDLHKSARRAKAGVIIFMILAVLLLAVIVWDVMDLFLLHPPADLPTEQAAASVETTEPTIETTEPAEDAPMLGATISAEQLDGQWIAVSVPYIPEDENYSSAANGGYYMFDPNGSFTYTQVQLVKTGTWKALEGEISYTGTYVLEGDMLTLHYNSCTEMIYDAETDSMLVNESVIDETDVVSMRINQSCTDMCVITPDHPKLGQLCLFRKGRGLDPVESLLVALNSEY